MLAERSLVLTGSKTSGMRNRAGFYLFPDVVNLLHKSFHGQCLEDVDHFAELLLEHAHVAVVPGPAFGSDRHVRISYSIPSEGIDAGFTRLEHFVQALVG